MIEYVKQLTTLRKKYIALRRGALTNLCANGKAFAFARHFENEIVILAINASREPITLDLRGNHLLQNGQRLVEEWTHEERTVEDGFVGGIEIPAREGRVWVAEGGRQ
jgi:glycosidase